MEQLPSDILLQIFSFLSVKDADRAMCCRRHVYVIDGLRRHVMGPELTAHSTQTVRDIERSSAASNRTKAASPFDLQGGGRCPPSTRITKRRKIRDTSPPPPPPPSAGNGDITPRRVIEATISNIRSRPNVAFCFYNSSTDRSEWVKDICTLLPSDAAIISARSEDGIQTNCFGSVESDSRFACMVGSFPGAKILPFEFGTDDDIVRYHAQLKQRLSDASEDSEEDIEKVDGGSSEPYWKIFVVYVVGHGRFPTIVGEDFVHELQLQHPDALIVGGVCDYGDIRVVPTQAEMAIHESMLKKKNIRQLKQIIVDFMGRNALDGIVGRDAHLAKAMRCIATCVKHVAKGIYGLAIGGRGATGLSLVSRGVRDRSGEVVPANGGLGSSSWRVHDAELLHPSSERYPFLSTPPSLLKPIHVIKSIENMASNVKMHAEEFVTDCDDMQYIGLRREGDDRFEVHEVAHVGGEGIYIETDRSPESMGSLARADIGLFELDGNACIEDLEASISHLRRRLKDRTLLGTIMFSCSERGPTSSILPRSMADANVFADSFPNTPCVGFYAGGEIGPRPFVRRKDDSTRWRGRASLQGYSVVFLVFTAPSSSARSGRIFLVDDSLENVAQHMEARMSQDVTPWGRSSWWC